MSQQMDGPGMGDVEELARLVVERLEWALAAIADGVRERPVAALAILAGVLGAVAGLSLATRQPRPKPRAPAVSEAAELLGAIVAALGAADLGRGGKGVANVVERIGKRQGGAFAWLRDMGDVSDLAGTGMRLLENPIVRAYLRAAVASQLRRRLAR